MEYSCNSDTLFRSEISKLIRDYIIDICRHSTLELTSVDSIPLISLQNFNSFIHDTIMNQIADNRILMELEKMKTVSERLFKHSIRTSVLSVVIGYRLSLPPKDLNYLALGGLLHDIGLVDIVERFPKMEDPDCSKLSFKEREIWKLHPMVGYNYVTNNLPFLGYPILRIILLHHLWSTPQHSKTEVKSFPKMYKYEVLNGSEKDTLVDIVQVSNFIERRVESLGMEEILKRVNNDIGVRFGASIININLFISPYAVGDKVLVNGCMIGRVFKQTTNPNRPIIKLESGEISNLITYDDVPKIETLSRMSREEFLNSEYSSNI